ncbi:MAG: GNAT family N-acetyltransferase [Alphaproteobacteria bacterium]
MADGGGLTARIIERISEVPAHEWDACAGRTNPFVTHVFLQALEESGSTTSESGWLPRHLVIENDRGRVLAAVPMYLKGHSYGEYVFDHGWADAFERAGGRYYPKLQVAVPFTPITGPRLLLRPAVDGGGSEAELRRAVIGALETMTERLGVSSLHVTFPTEDEWRELGRCGWIQRLGQQFHWYNRGYESFDDFLGALVSRKRKTIRKERRRVAEQGIHVHALSGPEIEPCHWDSFYRFYIDTYDRKWGYPYLTREFFEIVHERMADSVVLMVAAVEGRPVAGALNFRGTDALFGRNWGCERDYKFLHFEACYYQAIEYAIVHSLERVEAGTQGPHKIQRGYEPRPTYSAHLIRHAGLREAVTRFCASERAKLEREMTHLARYCPYRQEEEPAQVSVE